MSLLDFYNKFKKKKIEETPKPSFGQRVSSGISLIPKTANRIKSSFDSGIGRVADRSLKSWNNYKSTPKGGEWVSNQLAQTNYFKPVANKTRIRDVVREVPGATRKVSNTILRGMGEGATRLGISVAETPKALATGRATKKYYNTPFGRLNSFQSEAQNRVERGDPLWKAIGNPMLDTVLAGADVGALAKPVLGAVKNSSTVKKYAPEVGKVARDLLQPHKTMRPVSKVVKYDVLGKPRTIGEIEDVLKADQVKQGKGFFTDEIQAQAKRLAQQSKPKVFIKNQVQPGFDLQSKFFKGMQNPGMTIKATDKIAEKAKSSSNMMSPSMQPQLKTVGRELLPTKVGIEDKVKFTSSSAPTFDKSRLAQKKLLSNFKGVEKYKSDFPEWFGARKKYTWIKDSPVQFVFGDRPTYKRHIDGYVGPIYEFMRNKGKKYPFSHQNSPTVKLESSVKKSFYDDLTHQLVIKEHNADEVNKAIEDFLTKKTGISFNDYLKLKNKPAEAPKTKKELLVKQLKTAQKYSDLAKSDNYNIGMIKKQIYQIENSGWEGRSMEDALSRWEKDLNKIENFYATKKNQIENAVKNSNKIGIKPIISLDEKGIPVIYFELPTGQASFHLPNYGPDDFNSYNSVSELKEWLPEKLLQNANLVDGYKWSGLNNTNEVINAFDKAKFAHKHKEALGVFAGVERDEEGNLRFNPTKAAIGVGVMGGIKPKPFRDLIALKNKKALELVGKQIQNQKKMLDKAEEGFVAPGRVKAPKKLSLPSITELTDTPITPKPAQIATEMPKTTESPFKNKWSENFGKESAVNPFQQRAYEQKGERMKKLSEVLHHSPELQSVGYTKNQLDKMGIDQQKRVVGLAKLGFPKDQIEKLKGNWEQTDRILKNNVSWIKLKEYYSKKKALETNLLEGIDPSTIKDINPLMVGGRDVYRNLESAFGKNFGKIKKQLLDPFDEAKGEMIREQDFLANEVFENVVKKLGIKKGSALDKAVVAYGEGKINLSELQKNFPKDWRKVVQAENWFRQKYPRLLDDLNKVREANFPTHPLFPESTKIIPQRKDYFRHGKDLEGIAGLKNMFETSASIDPALAVASDVTNPKTKWLSFAQRRMGDDNDFGAVEGYLDYIKNHAYAKHIDPHIQKFKGIDDEAKDMLPNSTFIPQNRGLAEELAQKMDPLQQITDLKDAGKIKKILTDNGMSEAQSDWMGRELAEMDDYSQVKKFLQTKLAKNKNDVLGRLTVEKAAAESSENKANNLLVFIKNFSRDLAGKTNPIDRPFQENIFGRKVLGIANMLNSRFKANAVLGNLSSSLAQWFNVPQGVASAGVRNSAKGLGDSLAGVFKSNMPIKRSNFLRERYFKGFNKFDTGVLDNTKKFAVWVTSIGDEIGTKFIWNSHYRKALDDGVANPVKYADDWTRKIVAGRGIGEVPIAQKSKITQLIAPFQLEVANQWFALRDIAKGDPRKLAIAKKMIEFAVASFVMNRAVKEIRGADVSFDPINSMVEAYNEFSDEENKLMGGLKAGGRVAGEFISNVPGGQTLASMYPEYGDFMGKKVLPNRKDFFGEGDPTRFGTGGLPMFSAIKNPLTGVVLPYGGKQLEKTFTGAKALLAGYTQDKSGKVMTPVEATAGNIAKGLAFGKNALGEVQEYFDGKEKPLSELQSEKFKLLSNDRGYFEKIMNERNANKEKELMKKGKPSESAQISDELYQLSNGKVFSQVLDREFKNLESAQKALAIDDFSKSDENFRDLGDIVLRKAEDGTVHQMKKTSFTTSILQQKMEGQKRNKDIEGWMNTADQKLNLMAQMLEDPSFDELDKITIANDMETLMATYEKYLGYGGFTKPKSAGGRKPAEKYRYDLIDPDFLKIQSLLAGTNRKPTAQRRMLPLTFRKPPKITRRKRR